MYSYSNIHLFSSITDLSVKERSATVIVAILVSSIPLCKAEAIGNPSTDNIAADTISEIDDSSFFKISSEVIL